MRARILVIDNEECIRFTFENFLMDEGYEVATVRNYDEALTMISEKDFDLIFTECDLSGMTGLDVLKEIRKRNLSCSVVIITGEPDTETASNALRQGALDYISKPVRQETLLNLAKTALKTKIQKNVCHGTEVR